MRESQSNPVSITADFECSAINQKRKIFPETTIYWCFFHFGQCLYRVIQALGSQTWYDKRNNAFIIKQLQALTFVPPSDVCDLFNKLMESVDEETDEIVQYFEATWLGIIQRGKRRKPVFEIHLWSVHERVANDLLGKSNSVEGWHNTFYKRMMICHPTEDNLLRKLHLERASIEIILEQMQQGRDVIRKYKKYTIVNQRLKGIFHTFDINAGSEYFRAITHNL